MRKKGIKNRYWSKEELNYLKSNYGILRASEIAESLKTSERRVINKAYELKIKSNIGFTKQTNEKRIIEKIGKLFKIVSFNDSTRPNIIVECPVCKKEFSARPYRLIGGHTKTCGCSNLGLRRGTKHISKTFFNIIKRQAKVRNIEFDITLDYLESLLNNQKYKCALSNVDIVIGYWNDDTNGSLDRIDSSKGYIEGNVQWLHKDVNMCKQSLSNNEFIEMCTRIYNARLEHTGTN